MVRLLVCVIFYITLATLRRRPGGSQEGALGAPGLLTLALAWPLPGPGRGLGRSLALAWPWPGPGLALAWPWPWSGPGLSFAWPWPVLWLVAACGCAAVAGAVAAAAVGSVAGMAAVPVGGLPWLLSMAALAGGQTLIPLCKYSANPATYWAKNSSAHTRTCSAQRVCFLSKTASGVTIFFLFCFVFAEGPRWKEIMQLSVLTLVSDSHAT